MFLTRKGWRKIIIVAIVYAALGSVCIMMGLELAKTGYEGGTLVKLGLLVYVFGVLFTLTGRYAEGKGKWINEGNKLVRRELKPAEFIKVYENLKNDPTLVVNQPDVDILAMVSMCYDLLGDREKTLATADEMIAVANEKKKAYAKLTKASYLFSYGQIDAAEELYSEAQQGKLDFAAKGFVDAIVNCDRAMAMGDYKMLERYCLRVFERKFPKPDALAKLVLHYLLAQAYEKMQEHEKATTYYQYCAANGGETAIRQLAAEKLE